MDISRRETLPHSLAKGPSAKCTRSEKARDFPAAAAAELAGQCEQVNMQVRS